MGPAGDAGGRVTPSELTRAQRRRFDRLIKGLNDLLIEVRETIPTANYYMEGESGLHMLSGDSHDDHGKQRQDRILASGYMPHASGGAW